MKPDFSVRHPGPELMDRDDIPAEDLYQNYRELHSVNSKLGGYKITKKGLAPFLNTGNPLSVLDVGCGGGDSLKMVAGWARRKGIKMKLTGIDLSDAAIQYSTNNCRAYPEIEFVKEDVFEHLSSDKNYDVIMNCLFTHHFSYDQLVSLLGLMKKSCNKGFLINDLQRHPIAYYSIRSITSVVSKSYLVKNDAPLSVLRGFKEEEWWDLLAAAFIPNAEISWEWAFRYLVVWRK